MEEGSARVAFSLRPARQNYRCLDWGPGGYLAVASEQFVYVYKLENSRFGLIRTISKHRSNITVVRFSSGTVNLAHANAFQLFLAVGDESGNCLIYDVFTGARHSGFSPEKSTNVQICDVQWRPSNPSIVYVLTSQPCVLCLTNGSVRLRRYSELASWSGHGFSYQYFNMTYVYSMQVQSRSEFLCVDPFNPTTVLVCNNSGSYQVIRENVGSSLGISQAAKIVGLPNDEPLLNVEFYPHAENRIVGVLPSRIVLYDFVEKSGAMVIRNVMTQCPYASRIFNARENRVFWLPTTDGSVARIRLEEDNEKWVKQSCIVQNLALQKMSCFCVDPYVPTRAAVAAKDGSLHVIQEIGSKLFVVGMIPTFGEQIAAWSTVDDKLAFVSDKGYLTVICRDKRGLRLSVNDTGFESVCFTGSDGLVVGGRRLHKVDLVKRTIEQDRKQITPNKLVSEGPAFAYNPLANILDIALPGTDKRTIVFSDTIKAFSCKVGDIYKWAVVVLRSGLCIIDVSKEKPTQMRYKIKGKKRVTSLVYFGEKVVTASEAGEVVLVDMETCHITTRRLSLCPIKSMKYNSGTLLIVTAEFDFFLLDANDLHTTKEIRWKVMDACFLSNQLAVVKTSLSSLRILTLPNFESLSGGTSQNDIRDKFMQGDNIDDLEKLAMEVGDLDFVQFVRVFQNKGSLPVPSTYLLTKQDFIEKQATTLLIEKKTKHNAYIEFLILTGKVEQAAQELLASGNEDDLLFAYACLSPNLDAAKRLLTINNGDYSSMLAKMLVISGDPLTAISLLLREDDKFVPFKYARTLLEGPDYTNFMRNWIGDSPIQLKSPELRARAGDTYGCLSLLNQQAEVTKSYVYLRHLQKCNIPMESAIAPFGTDFDALTAKVEGHWTEYQAPEEI